MDDNEREDHSFGACSILEYRVNVLTEEAREVKREISFLREKIGKLNLALEKLETKIGTYVTIGAGVSAIISPILVIFIEIFLKKISE